MTWTFRTSYHYYFILYKNYIFLDRERQHAILSPLLPQFLRRRDANLIWTAVDILTSGIIKTSGSTTQYLTKVSSLHLCCRKAMSLFLNLYRKWFTKKMLTLRWITSSKVFSITAVAWGSQIFLRWNFLWRRTHCSTSRQDWGISSLCWINATFSLER